MQLWRLFSGRPDGWQDLSSISEESLLIWADQEKCHYRMFVFTIPGPWMTWSCLFEASHGLTLSVACGRESCKGEGNLPQTANDGLLWYVFEVFEPLAFTMSRNLNIYNICITASVLRLESNLWGERCLSSFVIGTPQAHKHMIHEKLP